MKATLKGISAMQQKGEIDEKTIGIVTDMIDKIETQLKSALDQDVAATQKLLDDEEAAIDACDTEKNRWAGDDFVSGGSTVSNSLQTFEQCHADEAKECKNATDTCDKYVKQIHDWNTCVKPNAARFEHDNDDIFKYMCCLEDFFTAESENYYDNRWACEEAVTIWADKTTECDGAQSDYEGEFCDQETKVQGACEKYRTCRNDAQETYSSVKTTVEGLEEIYRAQRVALECLICYGEHILANATDLSECETPPECTSLTDCPTITYDQPSCPSALLPHAHRCPDWSRTTACASPHATSTG